MYGIMYGVKRTTVYFPEEMKTAIEREAARRGVTEAEVIRGAVANLFGGQSRERRLNLPLFPEGFGENLAGHVDELLQGFGED